MSKFFTFLKRNLKMTITVTVSVLMIAGLTTALAINMTSPGRGSGRSGRAQAAHVSSEERHPDRGDRTGSGERGQRGDRSEREREPLTEEQIAERIEKARARLDEKLAEGSITQEEYDEKLALIESGDFRGLRGGKTRGECTQDDYKHTNNDSDITEDVQEES